MKIRVSEFFANALVENKITQMFSVVGGGAMYLNDAFGHKDGLTVIYNHHEQASSIAAEAYYRLHNEMAGGQLFIGQTAKLHLKWLSVFQSIG